VRPPDPPGGSRGSSLLELVFALLLLQVGLMGVAGMVLTGQRSLNRAQLILRATVDVARIGDSLRALEDPGAGILDAPWGTVAWFPGDEGSLRVLGTRAAGGDTLAALWLWPLPGKGGATTSGSPVSGGQP
jgi:hypothetical protein